MSVSVPCGVGGFYLHIAMCRGWARLNAGTLPLLLLLLCAAAPALLLLQLQPLSPTANRICGGHAGLCNVMLAAPLLTIVHLTPTSMYACLGPHHTTPCSILKAIHAAPTPACAERFRIEILFSPGASYNPYEVQEREREGVPHRGRTMSRDAATGLAGLAGDSPEPHPHSHSHSRSQGLSHSRGHSHQGEPAERSTSELPALVGLDEREPMHQPLERKQSCALRHSRSRRVSAGGEGGGVVTGCRGAKWHTIPVVPRVPLHEGPVGVTLEALENALLPMVGHGDALGGAECWGDVSLMRPPQFPLRPMPASWPLLFSITVHRCRGAPPILLCVCLELTLDCWHGALIYFVPYVYMPPSVLSCRPRWQSLPPRRTPRNCWRATTPV